MKKRILIIAGVGIVTLAFTFYFVRAHFFSNPFSEIKASITESHIPLAVEDARKKIRFPFPDSARNIQFVSFREWQAALDLIRFEAPVDICLKHAVLVLEQEYSEKAGKKVICELRPFNKEERILERPNYVKAPWFTPFKIQHGMVGGTGGSHSPYVWIDTEAGIFYYLYHD